jgi:hypothetical protein
MNQELMKIALQLRGISDGCSDKEVQKKLDALADELAETIIERTSH